MKNNIRNMFLSMCVMTLSFTLTACTGSDDASGTSDDGVQTEQGTLSEDGAAAEDDTAEDDGTVTDKYASIQEFVESELMQEKLASQTESLEGTGMSMELTAEDNRLIYDFKIDDPDLSAAMDTASLESTLDSQASAFESVAEVLPEVINVNDPVVVVRYLDSDGNELVSREFAPFDDTADNAAADAAEFAG